MISSSYKRIIVTFTILGLAPLITLATPQDYIHMINETTKAITCTADTQEISGKNIKPTLTVNFAPSSTPTNAVVWGTPGSFSDIILDVIKIQCKIGSDSNHEICNSFGSCGNLISKSNPPIHYISIKCNDANGCTRS